MPETASDNHLANPPTEDTTEDTVAEAIPASLLETLAPHLVWRIGRLADDAPITVRLGFAGATTHFAELPRLKNVSDKDLEQAVHDGSLTIEWVGHRS